MSRTQCSARLRGALLIRDREKHGACAVPGLHRITSCCAAPGTRCCITQLRFRVLSDRPLRQLADPGVLCEPFMLAPADRAIGAREEYRCGFKAPAVGGHAGTDMLPRPRAFDHHGTHSLLPAWPPAGAS